MEGLSFPKKIARLIAGVALVGQLSGACTPPNKNTGEKSMAPPPGQPAVDAGNGQGVDFEGQCGPRKPVVEEGNCVAPTQTNAGGSCTTGSSATGGGECK